MDRALPGYNHSDAFWRRLRLAALALVCAGVLAACASSPPARQVSDACDFFDDKDNWYKASKEAEARWGLPKSIQLAIIQQESAFVKNARPTRGRLLPFLPDRRLSSAYGYAQALDGTWETYQRATGRKNASRTNFGDSADFIAWYASMTTRKTGAPLYDARAQYLAYHEGHAGYQSGRWRSKRQLLAIADSVARDAASFETQLNSCKNRLERGVPLVPFV